MNKAPLCVAINQTSEGSKAHKLAKKMIQGKMQILMGKGVPLGILAQAIWFALEELVLGTPTKRYYKSCVRMKTLAVLFGLISRNDAQSSRSP